MNSSKDFGSGTVRIENLTRPWVLEPFTKPRFEEYFEGAISSGILQSEVSGRVGGPGRGLPAALTAVSRNGTIGFEA
jgi:hypothetical protein